MIFKMWLRILWEVEGLILIKRILIFLYDLFGRSFEIVIVEVGGFVLKIIVLIWENGLGSVVG